MKELVANFYFKDTLKKAVLEHYATFVPRKTSNESKFYNYWFNFMLLFTRRYMYAMRWMVEQSAAANTTFASVINSTVVRMRYFDGGVVRFW